MDGEIFSPECETPARALGSHRINESRSPAVARRHPTPSGNAPMKLSHWFTTLIIFLPAAIVLRWTHRPAPYIFVCSALSIIPLAGWMGTATEQLAERYGAGIGGLLNA